MTPRGTVPSRRPRGYSHRKRRKHGQSLMLSANRPRSASITGHIVDFACRIAFLSSTEPNDAPIGRPFDPRAAMWSVFPTRLFPDERLHKRVAEIWATAAAVFHGSGSGEALTTERTRRRGAQRLYDNERLAIEPLRQRGRRLTLQLTEKDDADLIAFHDSSEIDLSGRWAPSDAGPLRSSNARGYMMHAIVLVDAKEHVSRGFLAAETWTRSFELTHNDQRRPAEQKESYKWKRGLHAALEAAPERARLWTHVMDREGDVHENFEFALDERLNVIVGGQGDHRIVEGSGKLRRFLRHQPVLDRRDVEMTSSATGRREKRRLAIRAAEVTILPRKKYPTHRKRRPVTVNVVYVRGETAKQEWMLITTCAIDTLESVWSVWAAYRARTVGEEAFKMLKTGLLIEKESIRDITAFQRKLAILLPLATTIFEWRHQARMAPTAPAESCVDPDTLRDLRSAARFHRLKMPPGRWSVRHVVEVLARLGGYEPRADQPPGWLTMWRGWHVFAVFRDTVRFALQDHALERG